ncbi:alpha/beta hydrolase [Streptomyces ardesiacus]|uniref:alpha/beta hydrolase n=1 Tax=Streptomyces ardesiacus TaxID=285564 RepID=UPI0037F7FDDD
MTTSPDLSAAETATQERRTGYDAFMMRPMPRGVRTESTVMGGRAALELIPEHMENKSARLLYIHGGAFVMGSPTGYAGFVAQLTNRASIHTVSVDYRLAPEHPFPAAVDDALGAYRELLDQGTPADSIVLAGDSAGGNLVLAALLSARQAGHAMPAGAVLMSPVTDLSMASESMASKNGIDPLFVPEALAGPFAEYLAGTDPRAELASPVHADFSGFPDLLIQVGTHELLLDDATRLAARAAAHDVNVTLEVEAGAPHVFQIGYETSQTAASALDRIALFIGRALEASAHRA